MADTFSKEKRSEIMSRIRGTGNKATELKFIEYLRQYNITGWRRHQKLLGKPDFLFRKQRVAVFIDGCFWHGCPKHLRMPTSNEDYWQQKINNNIKRDKKVVRHLKKDGWEVIRIWQHDLSDVRIKPKVRRLQDLLAA